MLVINKVQELKEIQRRLHEEGKTIGLVPTMGYSTMEIEIDKFSLNKKSIAALKAHLRRTLKKTISLTLFLFCVCNEKS
mgnify:CR=1 FL=1